MSSSDLNGRPNLQGITAEINELNDTASEPEVVLSVAELNSTPVSQSPTGVAEVNAVEPSAKSSLDELLEIIIPKGISELARITNVPENPMNLFKNYIEEAQAYSQSLVPIFCLASVNSDNRILNRNVILRDYDDDGFIFVCERNSRKYQDFMDNPNVAGTFLWTYKKIDSLPTFTYHQIRINGYVMELKPDEIKKLYNEESLSAKIRTKICISSQLTDWKMLKKLHDDVFQKYKNGTEKLEQPAIYVAFRIIPKTIDFYHTEDHQIADRVIYTRSFFTGIWAHAHVCA